MLKKPVTTLLLAVALNAAVALAIPPLAMSNQRQPVAVTLMLCFLPVLFTVYLFFKSRHAGVRAIAILSAIPAVFWLIVGFDFARRAFGNM